MTYFFVFLLSNFLEVPVYWGFLSARGYGVAKSTLLVTAMNSLTHPIVFFAIMNIRWSYIGDILVAEAFAIGAEALILRAVTGGEWSWVFPASLLANLVSWQLAPVFTYEAWLAGLFG